MFKGIYIVHVLPLSILLLFNTCCSLPVAPLPTYLSSIQGNKLALPQPYTNYLKRSFSYRGAMLWNILSCELRSTVSLSEFKGKFRYYSFE